MSDSEDYEEYEELAESEPATEDEAAPGPDEAAPGPDEEDAGGSSEDEADEDEAADEADEDEPALRGDASQKAQPQRPRADPILRASNKPRTVVVVPPEERVTDNRLQKEEATRVLSVRAEQIAKYATHYANTTAHDPVAIAYAELFARRCPLVVRRVVGSGPAGELIVEDWKVREMTLPPLAPPASLASASATQW